MSKEKAYKNIRLFVFLTLDYPLHAGYNAKSHYLGNFLPNLF